MKYKTKHRYSFGDRRTETRCLSKTMDRVSGVRFMAEWFSQIDRRCGEASHSRCAFGDGEMDGLYRKSSFLLQPFVCSCGRGLYVRAASVRARFGWTANSPNTFGVLRLLPMPSSSSLPAASAA